MRISHWVNGFNIGVAIGNSDILTFDFDAVTCQFCHSFSRVFVNTELIKNESLEGANAVSGREKTANGGKQSQKTEETNQGKRKKNPNLKLIPVFSPAAFPLK